MFREIFGAAISLIMLLSLIPLSLCSSFEYSTFEDWQLESDHGYIARSGDTLRLWTDDTHNDAAVTICKEYQPTDDFTFSVEVNAGKLQACGLYVRGSLPAAGSFDGFNFEFGHYGAGNFILARNFTEWAPIFFGYGEPNVWYRMNLTVHRSPFLIEAEVFDEYGAQIGSISTSDIYHFTFEDIKYIGISVWGRSADYSFRNIRDPTPSQPLYSPYDEWQVEDAGGSISQNGDAIRLSTNGGGYYPLINYPAVYLYREFTPTGDFSFSAEVNAETVESCALILTERLPMIQFYGGFSLEFGNHGTNTFLTARKYIGGIDTIISQGNPHVWYTLKVTVTRSPYIITSAVYDGNGSLLGSYSETNSDFTFEDIHYVAFGVWGYKPADYSFRNIQAPTDSHGIVNKPGSSISISAACSPKIGSIVDISGFLKDSNGTPLQNKTVVLSYSFPGLKSWIPISSSQTSEYGEYKIQWINSASGTFTLKTEWSGDSTCAGASNTTTLNFLPARNQQMFVFESNSTVTALAFNNETATLTFNVTGPSGTTGFVRATIAKDLLADGGSLQSFLDGKQLEYSLSSTDDSWIYCFSYSHSTHLITMHLGSGASTQPTGNILILAAIISVFGFVIAVMVYSLNRRNKQACKQ